MTEIAEDVRKAAAEAHAAFARSSDKRNLGEIIEDAILDERMRCAKLAYTMAAAEHNRDAALALFNLHHRIKDSEQVVAPDGLIDALNTFHALGREA